MCIRDSLFHLGPALRQAAAGHLRRLSKSQDTRNILGARAHTALLPAARQEGGQPYALAGVQGTGALGTMYFVAAYSNEVGTCISHIYFTIALHCIGMENSPSLHSRDFRKGHNGTHLIVDCHDGNQYGLIVDGSLHLLHICLLYTSRCV